MKCILVHGFLGLPEDWTPIVEKLKFISPEYEYECVNLWQDLANNPKLSIQQWADQFVQKYGPKPIKAIGYSMGGRLLYEALYHKPELFHQLILVSSHPFQLSEEAQKMRKPWGELWGKKLLTDDWNQLISDWNSLPLFNASKDPFIRSSHLFDRNLLSYAMVGWSQTKQTRLVESAKLFDSKLKWICGEKDQKYSKLYFEFQKILKNQEFIHIPDCHHRVPWEQEDQFINSLL